MKYLSYTFVLVFMSLIGCTTLEKIGFPSVNKEPIITELSDDSSIPAHDEFECRYIYNGMDYRINEYRIETEYSELFSFTHSKLKPFFKTGHFMECFSSIASLGETNYLYLKIFFNSSQADKSYGTITKGENLRVKLINGEKLFLESLSESVANKKAKDNKIIYDGIFSISSNELEDLKKNEIDKIGIMWSYGFEEYDISNIELIKNQSECLSQNLP